MSTLRSGAVYDRGYRPYDGPRGGRQAAALALYRATLRRAVGLRRTWRQKFLPFALLAIVTVPAAVNVGIGYATRNSPLDDFSFFTFREYVGVSAALLLFVAVAAPDVLCPDRRQRVLPLIFSRPLTGYDYVAAKVGAIFTVVFLFSFLPQVVLFVGQMLVSDAAFAYVKENADVLWQVPLAVFVLALYYALLSLAVSSLTTRRVVAGATVLGLFLVSSVVAAVLYETQSPLWGVPADLIGLPLFIRDLIFLGHIEPGSELSGVSGAGVLAVAAYLVVVAACAALLLRRYRWLER